MSKLQLYAEGAATTAQPRVTDIVPRRKRFMFLWLLLALLPVGLVELLYWLRVNRLQSIYEYTSSLHLFGPGTLANWVASTLLLLSCLCCLLIFSVRRHKVDDYRGRYRLWLWSSIFCGLCSLDAATGLHRLFMVFMIRLTKNSLWANGAAWWLIIGGVVACLLIFKIFGDIWRSRGSTGGFVVAILCYVGATIFYLRLYSFGSSSADMMGWSTMLLCGHVLLFYSLLLYSRFVCLEASGEIKRAQRRRAKAKSASSTEAAETAASRLASPSSYRSLSNPPQKKSPGKRRKKVAKPKTAKPAAKVATKRANAEEQHGLEQLTGQEKTKVKVRRKERRRAA